MCAVPVHVKVDTGVHVSNCNTNTTKNSYAHATLNKHLHKTTNKTDKNMRIQQININGIINKRQELKTLAHIKQPDIKV